MPAQPASSRPGAPSPRLGRFVLAVAGVLLPLVVLELLVARRVVPLPEAASRYVHGCYEPTQPRRYIHGRVRPLKLKIHRPDFEADCYFQGYAWRHRSDGFGWRNPATWDAAELVLIGDSIVYGHGVDEHETAAHVLRGLTGQTVVNLGITGGSPVNYLANLRNFALPLRPAVVVVLSFGNDLADIRASRSAAEIERFVRTGEGREARRLPRTLLVERARRPGKYGASWLDRFALYRLVDYRVKFWQAGGTPAAGRRAGPPADRPGREIDLTPPSDAVLDGMEGRPTVAYLRRALALMGRSCEAAGASLVVGHIGRRTDVDWLLRRLLRETAAAGGFHYLDTPVMEGPHRLPGDGHLSPAGHRRLAEAVVAFLEDRALLRSSRESPPTPAGAPSDLTRGDG